MQEYAKHATGRIHVLSGQHNSKTRVHPESFFRQLYTMNRTNTFLGMIALALILIHRSFTNTLNTQTSLLQSCWMESKYYKAMYDAERVICRDLHQKTLLKQKDEEIYTGTIQSIPTLSGSAEQAQEPRRATDASKKEILRLRVSGTGD